MISYGEPGNRGQILPQALGQGIQLFTYHQPVATTDTDSLDLKNVRHNLAPLYFSVPFLATVGAVKIFHIDSISN